MLDNLFCCYDGFSLRVRLSIKSILSYCMVNDLNQFLEYVIELERIYLSKRFCEVDNNLDYILIEGIDLIDGKICILIVENN